MQRVQLPRCRVTEQLHLRLRPEHYALVVMGVSSDGLVAEASATANGAKMPRASWDVLKKYPVTLPPKEIEAQFSSAIKPMIAQQQALVFQVQNLRRTRDLLLPRLLSGQIEVEAAEEQAGQAVAAA